jgi:CelD/BcsL family acetyltransferase involved in cellulose biosynthesis
VLTTRILDEIGEAEAMRAEWSALVLRAPRGELVLTPAWLLAWWREFGRGDGLKLRMVTFRDGGTLVGLAPLSLRLVLHRRAIPVRRLALLATGEEEQHEICSDYVGVLCDAGYEEAIAQALARLVVEDRALGRWDELLMPAMSSEDPAVEQLRGAFEAAGAQVSVAETGRCPYVALPKTWEEYLKMLEGSSRYVVTRAMRELEKWAGKGGFELLRANTPEELATGRKVLHSLHGERWSGEGERGVFASERFARFHDEMMPQLLAGKDGQLDLFWLQVKGEPIAAVYNIVFRNKVYFYQSGRKLEVPKQVKPGIAIHALVMQRSIGLGHREYDFLNGASQYKMKLATATRPLVTLRAVAPSLRARAVEAARNLAEAAVTQVRERRKAAVRSTGAPPAHPGDGERGGEPAKAE